MEAAVNLHAINIEDEMRQSYMDYAMSVIIGRALPDVRDGLKPVQRRVLYAMLGLGLVPGKKHSKCAGVVGEVLKRLHPHGDIPVYDALVNLVQPWTKRYGLVDGQGNFGSIDGDSAAAYRYTECRLTHVAERMLEDIEKDTVDFIPNFDESSEEPVVLPCAVPNLLINGSDGIAVGMATHMPPHNLGEVVAAIIAYMNNPEIQLQELMKLIPGPDFPTGGIIYGRDGINSAYANGRGIIQLRAKTSIENLKTGSRECQAIVVTEIPFQVNKSRLIERIAELVNEKEVDGISKLRDESDRTGMRIVVELKRDATPEVVLNQLFKLTPLQDSFGVINLAIVEGRPEILPLSGIIKNFVFHRRDVVTRRTHFELRKAEARMHLLEGFRIALLNLDAVIELIKKSESPAEARQGLMSKYSLSEIQAQAILDLRLQKLTGMERLAIEQEHAELAKEIERLKGILSDTKKVDALIIAELTEIGEKYGDKRRTEIVSQQAEINVEDLIEDEEMVVTLSHRGYIKRTPIVNYRAQKRGGKGITGAAQQDDDFIEHLFVASTHDDLMVFTSRGRLYWQKVYEIPESARNTRGRALVNVLNLKEEESITAVLPVRGISETHHLFMATEQGVVKRVMLSEFAGSRRTNGIIACKLRDGDNLIGVGISSGEDEIILCSKQGMAMRFQEAKVRDMGRTAVGVRGMRLDDGDAVVSMTIVSNLVAGAPAVVGKAGKDGTLLTVCENGYGKRSLIEDYRLTGRGARGVIDIKTSDRNGPVIAACAVTDESELMLITTAGKVIRIRSKELSIIGRNTGGVRLINLEPGEKVAAVAHLAETE